LGAKSSDLSDGFKSIIATILRGVPCLNGKNHQLPKSKDGIQCASYWWG